MQKLILIHIFSFILIISPSSILSTWFHPLLSQVWKQQFRKLIWYVVCTLCWVVYSLAIKGEVTIIKMTTLELLQTTLSNLFQKKNFCSQEAKKYPYRPGFNFILQYFFVYSMTTFTLVIFKYTKHFWFYTKKSKIEGI